MVGGCGGSGGVAGVVVAAECRKFYKNESRIQKARRRRYSATARARPSCCSLSSSGAKRDSDSSSRSCLDSIASAASLAIQFADTAEPRPACALFAAFSLYVKGAAFLFCGGGFSSAQMMLHGAQSPSAVSPALPAVAADAAPEAGDQQTRLQRRKRKAGTQTNERLSKRLSLLNLGVYLLLFIPFVCHKLTRSR